MNNTLAIPVSRQKYTVADASQEALIVLSPGFPVNEADTGCLPAQQALVRCLQALYPGTRVIVIAFQYPFQPGTRLWHGIRVTSLGGKNRGGPFRLLTWYRAWKQLRGLHRQYRITGILCFWAGECALLGYYFARCRQLVQATWLLGQDARKGNRYPALFRPPARSLIAISDFIAQQYLRHHGVLPGSIVPNGIDPALFSTARNTRTIDILGAGSLIPLKRYDLFIDIVAGLRPIFPHLSVTLCGDGPERQFLQKCIHEKGLGDTIRLAGALPHQELLALMQRCRVFLHTSAYEGFSGVCLEALYAGAHVVSSCYPQQAWIRHWHRADTKGQMIKYCTELLSQDTPDHSPVLPYPMSDTARQIMEVFSRPS